MKNTLMVIGLIAALICVNQIWAQEEESVNVVVAEVVTQAEEKRGSVKLAIDLGEQATPRESIDKVSALIREIAGDEVADEVVLELEGLSEEEKKELAESIKRGFKFNTDHVPGWVGVVAILAVILIFGSPILVLIAVFFFLSRKRKEKMNMIQVYLDAGKDVPPELLRTFDGGSNSFRSGVMLTGVGLGIIAAFNAANEPSIGALGLIPLFLGVAKLLYWFFEERKLNQV